MPGSFCLLAVTPLPPMITRAQQPATPVITYEPGS